MITEISKAYKFRIYPNEQQQEIIQKGIDVDRFSFNHLLKIEVDTAERLKSYGYTTSEELKACRKKYKLYFDKFAASNYLTMLSKTEFGSFISEVHSSIRSYSITHLQNAFDNMTKTGAGYPKFKKRWENKSYTIQIRKPLKIVYIKNKHYLITIPSTVKNKLENIPLTCHIPEFIDNLSNLKVNSMTVSKNGQKQYFISIQVQEFIDIPDKADIVEERSIGIDMGVVRPITTSDDCNFNNELFSNRIKTLNETDEHIKMLSRALSKQRSKNPEYKKAKSYVRLLKRYNKLILTSTNQKEWIRHNISSSLISDTNYDTLILEDLKIKNMTKRSGKGLSNKKSKLNRVILQTGLYEIKRQMEYKSIWEGKNVVYVDPKYTSQTCSVCGNVDKLNRVSQSEFVCTACGHKENADSNAAKNIKKKYFKKNLEN